MCVCVSITLPLSNLHVRHPVPYPSSWKDEFDRVCCYAFQRSHVCDRGPGCPVWHSIAPACAGFNVTACRGPRPKCEQMVRLFPLVLVIIILVVAIGLFMSLCYRTLDYSYRTRRLERRAQMAMALEMQAL